MCVRCSIRYSPVIRASIILISISCPNRPCIAEKPAAVVKGLAAGPGSQGDQRFLASHASSLSSRSLQARCHRNHNHHHLLLRRALSPLSILIAFAIIPRIHPIALHPHSLRSWIGSRSRPSVQIPAAALPDCLLACSSSLH